MDKRTIEKIRKDYLNCKHTKAELSRLYKMSYYKIEKTVEGIEPDIIGSIRKEFKDAGYELISTEYIKSDKKLKYICPTHGEQEISLNHFRNGRRCRECYEDSIKLAIESARKIFSDAGYELYAKRVSGKKDQVFDYICPTHGIQSTTLSNFRKHTGCPECSRDEAYRKRFEKVKKAFNAKGYKLLSKSCSKLTEKVRYECPIHGEQEMSYVNLSNGMICDDCKNDKEISKISKLFKDRGYELLSKKYISTEKLKYICPVHGEKEIYLNHFKIGQGCAECSATNNKLSFKEVEKAFNDAGYKLVKQEYINSQTPMKFICPEHGLGEMTYGQIQQGHRCKRCMNKGLYNKTLAERNKSKWKKEVAKLYFVKLTDENTGESFLKVGLTVGRLRRRFRKFPYDIIILSISEIDLYNAVYLEDEIIGKYSDFSYEPSIMFGGHKECLSLEVEKKIRKDITKKIRKTISAYRIGKNQEPIRVLFLIIKILDLSIMS